MEHVGGNLRSRFADFRATDGEKASRDRDAEFVDDLPAGNSGRDAAWARLERRMERPRVHASQPWSMAISVAP
jgi:hypothetical protein